MNQKKKTPKAPVAKVFRYGDIVEYQEGAIVSRTLIEGKAGTVTVFAFDEGQQLSEHTAPFDALVEIVDGSAIITIDGNDHRLAPGQQIIMPANIPHAVRAEERFKMVLILIRK
jgi:quercetin dioxygenase-like cupin family protein